MRTRSDKPIALGTWRERGKRPPTVDAGQFAPVDTTPPGSAFGDTIESMNKRDRDLRAGVHPGVAVAKEVIRLVAGARRERGRRGPTWSVRQAGHAAGAFLDEVAFYCLGHRAWNLAAEAPLVESVPGLAGPLRVLEVARKDLAAREKFFALGDASALTDPALEAAQRTAQLIQEHYRAVPPVALMPWVGIRATGAQRARAVGHAASNYDRLIAHWYEFVFTSAPLSSRQAELADLGEELQVTDEIVACERQRQRCWELAGTGAITRLPARQAVKDLDAAISAFEEVIYHAAASPVSNG